MCTEKTGSIFPQLRFPIKFDQETVKLVPNISVVALSRISSLFALKLLDDILNMTGRNRRTVRAFVSFSLLYICK